MRKRICGGGKRSLVAMMFHQEGIKTIHTHCKQDASPELGDGLPIDTLRSEHPDETASRPWNIILAPRFLNLESTTPVSMGNLSQTDVHLTTPT
jgi:hypothetical protein